MNRKNIVLLSLMITVEFFVFGRIILTDFESNWFNVFKSSLCTKDMLLTVNLPLIGELNLSHIFDRENRKLHFEGEKSGILDLSPTPIILENIHIIENHDDLILGAKAKVFGRDAEMSVNSIKRKKIEIVDNPDVAKLFLDILEITLLFKFEELSIKLFDEISLKFNSASLILRKDKPHQFMVKGNILGQTVDFEFNFLPNDKTLIKYLIHDDVLLSKVLSASKLNLNDITLKNLSLTNEYETEALFSNSSNIKIHGTAFADVQIIEDNIPLNLIDLPAIINHQNEKFNLSIKLPQLTLPILGTLSQGFIKVSDSIQVSGNGILNLPQIGAHKYELQGIYEQGRILLRGTLDRAIKYDNIAIEAPKFTIDSHAKSIKIIGKSVIQNIKCLVELIIKDLDLFGQIKPELKIHALQKSWRPFVDSKNKNLTNIELRSPRLLLVNNKGNQEIVLIGTTKFLNGDYNAQINFVKTAQGEMPVVKINLPESCWRISDSFAHIKKFDHLTFKEPQLILSDAAYFDSKLHMFFNKGINFVGKLLLNKNLPLISNTIALTEGDIVIAGSISPDLKNFIWQGPLASCLSTKSDILNIGPMYLELNSNAPMSILTTMSIHPTKTKALNFSGNFKLFGKKLIFDSVSTESWDNVFSVTGLKMTNPRLLVTLHNDHFSANSTPDNIILEGTLHLGKSAMPVRSIMHEDLSRFTLAGHWDHFWLNELADNAIDNKQIYTVLPPLEVKKITFNVSPEHGFSFNGVLGIFGFDINVNGKASNTNVKINGILPKMIHESTEILGKDCRLGPQLIVEAINDKNVSKLIGNIKFGNLLEIYAPILIDTNGCTFESNATIGDQKLGVKVAGKSSGFIKIPEFELDCTFKPDAINYFKKAILKEFEIAERAFKVEVDTVISAIKLLETNLDVIEDIEQRKIAAWALEENKRKLNNWVAAGLVKVDKNKEHIFYGIINQFDLIDIKFHGSADQIKGSKIPLDFVINLKDQQREIKFIIDFSKLDQSIVELVKEIGLLVTEDFKQ